MHRQVGKIGVIRRELRGRACPFCGGCKYQLVLRATCQPVARDFLHVVVSATVPKNLMRIWDKFFGCSHNSRSAAKFFEKNLITRRGDLTCERQRQKAEFFSNDVVTLLGSDPRPLNSTISRQSTC